ncbi:MAG: beta strand repeat-containing protein, partial [Bacteroidota bacterium]
GTVTVFTTAATSNVSSTITNTGNDFSNITVSGATILTGWSQLDVGLTTKSISNNTFANWSAATGAITVMTVNGFGNTSAIAGNTISAISSEAAITGITIGATGSATALNVNGNTITGLASTAAGGGVTALASSNNSTAVNIFSNSITNLSTSGASATVSGISVTGGTGTVSIYTNTLNNIRGTGITSPIAQGVAISGVTTDTVLVYKNKIYDIAENGISTGAIVYGFNITGGTIVTCSNNIIGDLKAPNVSSASAVRGIFINSAALNSSYRLYYNSVYLNATSTGANFGSYGLYHNTTTTATTANLILNNNVIVNVSTASGTGFTTAFFLSSTALAHYDLSSNNNLFYAGVPGTKNVLLSVSTTNYSTLNDLQGFVLPREVGSVTENVTFISTTASSADF